jgi:hypothetical protein
MVIAIALLSMLLAAGQARPDFSGRWTSEPETSAAGARADVPVSGPRRGDMGSGWGPTLTITQTAATLTVEYAFFGRGDMQPPLTFKFALDGSPTTNAVMMGRGIQVQTSRRRGKATR